MKRSHLVILVVLLVLAIDQASKIWVKTHMSFGEQFGIFGSSRAFIHFIENPGMAFGLELGGSYGKLALSLFRIFAIGFLIYLIQQLILQKAKTGVLLCFAFILAGAIGNIIDSAFYGLLFSESSFHHAGPAEMFPADGGYAGFLHGRVVDMLYFPLFSGQFPEWFPFWGGKPFLFFRPVFNVADAAISGGVFWLLAFHSSFFRAGDRPKENEEPMREAGIEALDSSSELSEADPSPPVDPNSTLEA